MKLTHPSQHGLHAPQEILVPGMVVPNLESPTRTEAPLIRMAPGDPATILAGEVRAVDERRMASMAEFVEDAAQRGTRVALGGERIGRSGNFAPTVLMEPPPESKITQAEPFGPVAACTGFTDLDGALRRANSLPYELSPFVFTSSTRNALRIQNGIEAGMVNINHFGQALPDTPFGGVNDSGIGSEGGTETFDGYLVTNFATETD